MIDFQCMPYYLIAATVLLFALSSLFKILNEYERGVVFRLGRLVSPRGPGLVVLIPGIERMRRVDLRIIAMDVPWQDVITKDNVTAKINAVAYFRVLDASKSIVEVENFSFATSQLAQTSLRGVCGESELDDLLINRKKLNTRMREILDEATDPWGIEVSMVEIKHIELPVGFTRTMAKQAEAERERRAKIIDAEGEFQAAQKLVDAAAIIAKHPEALQLRYLQTLREIATETNSTTIFPIPIDILSMALPKNEQL